nr:hypothetical protein [uncultured Lachnoclostridium sp.]
MNNNYEEWCNTINRMIGNDYDIECIIRRDDYIYNRNFINSPRDIIFYKYYKNVKLINIMGSFERFDFQTENGELLIIPGRYIISIFPSKKKEK